MKKRKVDVRAVIMLLFALIAVLLLMLQLQRMTPKPPEEFAKLANARFAVVDSTYINLPLQFSIKMPNRFWELSILTHDTLVPRFNTPRNMDAHILWLLSATRIAQEDTLAVCTIGVMRCETGLTAADLAINYLAEMISAYEQPGKRIHIVQPVSSPAHQLLKGAYFMINLSDFSGIKMPVWLVALLPRGERLYIIRSKTTEIFYPLVREELQEIVQRFHPLPLAK